MQHDLFHVYTVDEHILMVVRNLRRFAVPEFAHEYPLCSKLIAEFARPEVLYIAGLFHDIAKGRGGDHAELGKKDAHAFCVQHRLSRDDTDLIVWLVGQHLTLSATAQEAGPVRSRGDRQFRRPDQERPLPGRAVPAHRRRCARHQPQGVECVEGPVDGKTCSADTPLPQRRPGRDQLGAIRSEAASALNLYALSPDNYRMLWAQLDDSYFLDHEAQEIAWQTRLLAFKVDPGAPIVKARLSRAGEGLQVLVYCPDQRGLFARICDFSRG